MIQAHQLSFPFLRRKIERIIKQTPVYLSLRFIALSPTFALLIFLSPKVCMCIYMHTYMSFPGGVSGKESACKAGDLGDVDLIPGWGRSPGGGHGSPLQYSCLEDSTQKGAWQATVRGVQRVRHNLTNERTHTLMLAVTSVVSNSL